jgi:hypothetical protein
VVVVVVVALGKLFKIVMVLVDALMVHAFAMVISAEVGDLRYFDYGMVMYAALLVTSARTFSCDNGCSEASCSCYEDGIIRRGCKGYSYHGAAFV